MCGIIGWVHSHSSFKGDMHAALPFLLSRGPDATATRVIHGGEAECFLGHTRLRIIDVSETADQPMTSEDGKIWVVYNGEIYNHREIRRGLEEKGHRFRSQSDTEVLVHLYEECNGNLKQMLKKLRGMFAFAIFDRTSGQIMLARDRLGIKPLYWSEIGSGIAFSSSVRALRASGASSSSGPSLEAIKSYLAWGTVQGPSTILQNVRELSPGHFLRWTPKKTEVDRWWAPAPEPGLSDTDSVSLLRSVLTDAVSRHLVADRPVGVFLSGGLDSSVVAKLAAQEGELHCITVGYPDRPQEDEFAGASKFARSLGAAHFNAAITGEEVAARLPDILGSMDQPTHDGVNVWLVSKAAKEAGIVVALSGLGGDELFGGYGSFKWLPWVKRVTTMTGSLSPSIRLAMVRSLSRRAPGSRLIRLIGAGKGSIEAYRAVRGMFSPMELIASDIDRSSNGEKNGFASDGRAVTMYELTRYLPNQLLRDTDQMSMAHSIEVRVPLLDDIVVRTVLALPDGVRLAAGKSLLAEASDIKDWEIKRPFALPFGHWMRGPLAEVTREGLLSSELPFSDLIDRTSREHLWEAFQAGRVHWSKPWAICVLRLWSALHAIA